MAAGDSIVSICNIALLALGEDPIVSLTDNTKRAILCKARYDDVRRAALRKHPWACGKKLASLAALSTAPAFGYGNAFQLPADFIRMVDLPDNRTAAWDVVGSTIQTDEGGPLNIVYIYDLQDPAQFDPLLVQSIAADLMAELAQPLTQSESKKASADKTSNSKRDDARLASSQGNSTKEWDTDVWLASRA